MTQEPATDSEPSAQELSHIHGLYHKLKVSAFASMERPVAPVQLIREDLVPQLQGSVLHYHQWQRRKVRTSCCSGSLLTRGAVVRRRRR